jgi:Ca2+-binding EF-hand superfamily protein
MRATRVLTSRSFFKIFDEKNTGAVTARRLRHVLHEIECPDALSETEFLEFMHYAGLAKNGDYRAHNQCQIGDLLSKLIMGGL